MANRAHSLTRKLFNWCVEREIVTTSPLRGSSRPLWSLPATAF